jgi:hypothetical protein
MLNFFFGRDAGDVNELVVASWLHAAKPSRFRQGRRKQDDVPNHNLDLPARISRAQSDDSARQEVVGVKAYVGDRSSRPQVYPCTIWCKPRTLLGSVFDS